MWLYTASVVDGVIRDPCKGDSGGPLIIDNGGQPLLVGVLEVKLLYCQDDKRMLFIISPKGEGFNCRTNRSSGDGLWSNVVSQRDWVLEHISDNIVGKCVAVLLLAGWFGLVG